MDGASGSSYLRRPTGSSLSFCQLLYHNGRQGLSFITDSFITTNLASCIFLLRCRFSAKYLCSNDTLTHVALVQSKVIEHLALRHKSNQHWTSDVLYLLVHQVLFIRLIFP